MNLDFNQGFILKTGTKDKLLKESLKIIRKNGLKGLSIRGLTEKVGIKGSSFYEHFKSKHDLLDVVRGTSLSLLYKEMQDSGADIKLPKKQLINYGLAYVKFSLLRPDEFHLLFVESESKRQSPGEEVVDSSPYSLLMKSFSLLVNKKKIDDIETLCFGYWSIVHGISCLRAGHLKNYKVDFERKTKKVLTTYLDGIRV